MVLATEPSLRHNKRARVSLLSWRSTRLKRAVASTVAAETLAGWRERYPDVEVRVTVAHGRPGPMLVKATERASLTVVGSRGRGAFLGVLLGSTSQSLLQHATGSVAVLRRHKH